MRNRSVDGEPSAATILEKKKKEEEEAKRYAPLESFFYCAVNNAVASRTKGEIFEKTAFHLRMKNAWRKMRGQFTLWLGKLGNYCVTAVPSRIFAKAHYYESQFVIFVIKDLIATLICRGFGEDDKFMSVRIK